MKGFALGLVSCVLIGVVAGCGSSGDGWTVVTRGQKISGADPGYVSGTVGRPSDVEARIESSPNVTAQTHYTITCGEEVRNRRGPKVETPMTVQFALPIGLPGPCTVTVGATKSKPSTMTLTILMREPPKS